MRKIKVEQTFNFIVVITDDGRVWQEGPFFFTRRAVESMQHAIIRSEVDDAVTTGPG